MSLSLLIAFLINVTSARVIKERVIIDNKRVCRNDPLLTMFTGVLSLSIAEDSFAERINHYLLAFHIHNNRP